MRKAAILALLILLFTTPAFSQNVRVDNVTFSSVQGFPFLPGATITICTAAGSGLPCSPTVAGTCLSISDATCNQSASLTSDAFGNYGFWIQPGSYSYTVTKAGFGGFGPRALTLACQPTAACTFSGPLNSSNTATGISACIQNGAYIVGSSCYATIQAAITAAGTAGSVLIPRTYTGTDSYTSPATVPILDQRTKTFLNITPSLNVDSTISTVRPVLDNAGAVVPLGPDLSLEGDGAADVSETNNDITLTSSTSVAAPGISTIVVSASFTITCNGVSSSTNPTACLYPGNVGHSGAPIAVDACYIPINGPSCNNGADEENLNPSTNSCGTLPASTFAIVDATHICGNFAKAHTSTPYTLSQRGAFIIRAYTFFTTDTDATPLFTVRHFGTTAAHGNRDWGISRGSGPSDYVVKSGDGATNHIHRMFGNTSGTGTTLQFVQGNCGFFPCGTGTNNTANSHIDFVDNETDQTQLFRIDGIGQEFSRSGYFCTNPGGCQVGAASTPIASVFFGPNAANNWGFKGTGTTGNSTITFVGSTVTPTWTVQSSSGTVPMLIASGTSTMTSGAITAATCQAAITTPATNTATTDAIEWSYATAPTLTTDALLTIAPYVTANNVNFTRCNPTAGSITGTAIVINWRVIR